MKPTQRRCETCEHFLSRGSRTGEFWGRCRELEDYVKGYWSGCVRHKERAAPAPSTREKP